VVVTAGGPRTALSETPGLGGASGGEEDRVHTSGSLEKDRK